MLKSPKKKVGPRTQKQDGTQHTFKKNARFFSPHHITVWGSIFLLAIRGRHWKKTTGKKI